MTKLITKKKSNLPWFLTLTLIILLMLIWVFNDFLRQNVTNLVTAPFSKTPEPVNTTPAPVKTPPEEIITDIAVYSKTTDKASLAGKKAALDGLRIVRLIGPRTFTAAAGDGQEIIVMIADDSGQGVGTQGKLRVGKTIELTGTFERFGESQIETIANNRFRKLSPPELETLKNTEIYLHAAQIIKIA